MSEPGLTRHATRDARDVSDVSVVHDLPPEVVPDEPAPPSRMRGRAVWSLFDQAVSSLTNAVLSIVVAREIGIASYGAFSLALITFAFVIGVARAMVSDILVIRFTDVPEEVRRRAGRAATGGAALMGAATGLVCAVAGYLTGGETSQALYALALALPGLLVQDTFRFIFFAAGHPKAAAINDVVWAVVQFAALGVLFVSDHKSVFLITLAWGAAALVAAVTACVQARLLPDLTQAKAWFVDHRDLNVRMGIEYATNMGAVNLATYVITAFIGLAGVGAIRAAQVLLGPLQLLASGIQSFVLPDMSTRAGRGQRLVRSALLTSAVLTAVAGTWVAILVLIPEAWGRELLKDSWDGAHSVMLPAGLTMVVIATSVGPALALRALRRPDMMLRVTLCQAPCILIFGVIGAILGGAVGAATGFALAQTIGTVAIWICVQIADVAPRDYIEDHVRDELRARPGRRWRI
jgi:O-antigen/teichoic acid export membrane protein